MSYLDFEKFTSLIGSFSFGMILGCGVIYFFIKSFLPSYLTEKAKNLASKEDIELITEKVESVKSDYAHLLEEVRSNYQLKFAAIEREKSTKKEVYMEAIEAITRSQNIIPSFCNLNLSEEQITSSLSSDAGKIAKVQVVGDKETVKAVTAYMAEIGIATLDLMLKRSALIERRYSIQAHELLRDKSQGEIERYIGVMKNMNLQGHMEPSLWEIVNRSLEFEREQCDKFQGKLDLLFSEQNKAHLEFTRESMDRFFNICESLPSAVLAIRKELDLDILSEDYLNIIKEDVRKGREVFMAFLNRLGGINS
ncbi:hypothetical protein Q7C15_11830 [Aeromonas salmonicida]|uniref:hypothetical protein n=1 Tax=Aeromonas salmonicida TaxID=645 RepID=UPI0035BF9E53